MSRNSSDGGVETGQEVVNCIEHKTEKSGVELKR